MRESNHTRQQTPSENKPVTGGTPKECGVQTESAPPTPPPGVRDVHNLQPFVADAHIPQLGGVCRVRVWSTVPQELAELQELAPILLRRAGQAECSEYPTHCLPPKQHSQEKGGAELASAKRYAAWFTDSNSARDEPERRTRRFMAALERSVLRPTSSATRASPAVGG